MPLPFLTADRAFDDERGRRRAALRRPRPLAAPLPARSLAGRRGGAAAAARLVRALRGGDHRVRRRAAGRAASAWRLAAGRHRRARCGCCGWACGSARTGCAGWASSSPRRCRGSRSCAVRTVQQPVRWLGLPRTVQGQALRRRTRAGAADAAAAADRRTTPTSWRAPRRSTGRRTPSRPGPPSTAAADADGTEGAGPRAAGPSPCGQASLDGLAVVQGDRALHGLAGARGVAGVVVGDGEPEPAAPVVRGVLGLGLARWRRPRRPSRGRSGRRACAPARRRAGRPRRPARAASRLALRANWVFCQRNQTPMTGRISTAHAEGDGEQRAVLDEQHAPAADQDEVEDQDGGQ